MPQQKHAVNPRTYGMPPPPPLITLAMLYYRSLVLHVGFINHGNYTVNVIDSAIPYFRT